MKYNITTLMYHGSLVLLERENIRCLIEADNDRFLIEPVGALLDTDRFLPEADL